MSTVSTVQNNGAQFAMISLAALQNSKLAGEFICEIDSSNCTETITYFQQAQNFTSSFACFTQSLQNQGNPSINSAGGGETLFNISRVGDVLLGLTAVITLPRLYSKISVVDGDDVDKTDAQGYQCAWVKNVGHHVINKCELLAQDTVIESFGNVGTGAPGGGVYGAFMDCHMGMTNTSGKAQLYDTMIGNRPELTNLAVRPNTDIPGDNVIYCPLQLSFCAKNDSGVPAAPLPVCALAYCTLQVKIGLNKFTDVAIQGAQPHTFATDVGVAKGQNITGSELTTIVGKADASDLEPQTVVQANEANVGVDGNYGVQMLAEYAMVSSQERAALACAKTTQHVLHRQAHAHVWKPGQNPQLTTTITFSGCNAYWWSLFQNTGLKFTAAQSDVPGVDVTQSGSLYSSNYTSGYQCAGAHGIVGPIQTSALAYVQGACGADAVVDVGVNPIGNIKINADSSPILDVSNHITAWYNWWWKTNNSGCDGVSTGMNLIPFCLTTEFYAIEANGGFLNLSKLTNVTESVTLAKEPRSASGPLAGPATMKSGTLSTHTGLVSAPDNGDAEYPLTDTSRAVNIPQKYNHYVLSVAYNSIVVSGGTLQHPYY